MAASYRGSPPTPKRKTLFYILDNSFPCSCLGSPPVHISPNTVVSVLADFYTADGITLNICVLLPFRERLTQVGHRCHYFSF